MDRCFKDGTPSEEPDKARFLSARTRSEWQVRAVLAPLLSIPVDVDHSKVVFGSDASEVRGAAVSDPLSPSAAARLWTRRERRGCYTWLRGRDAQTQARIGADPELAMLKESFTLPMGSFSLHRVQAETFQFLEVFCGVHSPFSSAALDVGRKCGPRIDLRLSSALGYAPH